MKKRPQGPNVKRLIARQMAKLVVPAGGGFGDVLEFLTDKKRILQTAREATDLVFAYIDQLKAAPDCPWTTDEEIAGAILSAIDAKRRAAGGEVSDAEAR
jgi:hypothetical protein